MLSIIISSYQPHYYIALEKNIAETIGIPYEIIKIDNNGIMGICEAYNRGAEKAQYDFLLFLHEDVLFETQDWGEILIIHLKKENTGVIGIAGSNYVPNAPIGWHIPDEKSNFLNLIQNDKNNNQPKLECNIKSSQQVYALDGVFMAVKKNIYINFNFDESLKGFHGYDLDFSLRIAQKYQNLVINDILIEHFSLGNPNKEWLDSITYVKEKDLFHSNQVYNFEIEKLSFLIYLRNYFRYNKCNFQNLLYTLKFFSFKLFIYSFFVVLKTYKYYYLRDLK